MPDVRSVRSVSSPLLAVTALLLLGPPILRAEEGSKSLAETVRGTERLSGLVTFYRAPGKLLLEVPCDLVGAPLGLGVTLVQAAGDWLPRGEVFDNSLVTWERAGRGRVDAALKKAGGNAYTRAHLEDLGARIRRTLGELRG